MEPVDVLKLVEAKLDQYSDYAAFDLLLTRACEGPIIYDVCKFAVSRYYDPQLRPRDWVRAAIAALDSTWVPTPKFDEQEPGDASDVTDKTDRL